jgi:hypothetical protein
MASQTVTGTGSTVNDGGTVVNGGNIGGDGDTAKFTKNLALTDVNGTGARTGSVIVAKSGGSATAPATTLETNPDGIQTALSAGTLAYFPSSDDRNFIVRGAGSTAAGKINNSATNGARLTMPAGDVNDHGRIPVSIISTMSHGVRDIEVTALPNKDRHPEMTRTGGGAPSAFRNPADDTAAVRSEIDPSRAVPGELTYMFGGKNPKSDDYKSKEAAES